MLHDNKLIISSAYAEIWNRIIYYGVQATLVIYLVDFLNLPESRSYQLYGTYTALTLGFSILGGVLADKVFGYFYSIVLGSFLVMLGNTLLYLKSLDSIYFAISSISVGIGLFKPNNSSLLGDIIIAVDSKGRIFSIFYLFINVGSLLGPLIYGYFINASSIYFLTTFGMFSAILLLNRFYSPLQTNDIKFNSKLPIKLASIILICFTVIMTDIVLRFESLTNLIVFIFAMINLFFLVHIFLKISSIERKKLWLLVVPIVSSIFYFIFLLQIFTSILSYINVYVDRNILNWMVPTSWFSALEPLFLIVSVPLLGVVWKIFNKRNIVFSDSKKVVLGLAFGSLSFLIFSAATVISNHELNLTLILIANFILALAELCVIPLSIALINTIAPQKYKSTLMAIYYSTLAISGYLAGFVSKLPLVSGYSGAKAYTFSFLLMSLTLFIIFSFMLFIHQIIKTFK